MLFSFNKYLSTIQGKVIAMVVFFLVSFISFTIWNAVQNNRLKSISEKTIQFRMPVTLNANSILSGLNRVAAAQRGYLMTKSTHFKAERHMVWDSQIKPAFDDLMSKRDELSSHQNKLRLDTLNELLNEYYVIQDEIDNYVLQNLNFDDEITTGIDSTNAIAILGEINNNRLKKRELLSMIENRASPIRKKMRGLLQPFAARNNAYIKEEIASVNDRWGIFIALFSITVSILIAISVIINLKKSIRKPIILLNDLAKGKIPEHSNPTKDELGSIVKSGNVLAENLRSASEFALQVGEGDFNMPFKASSEEDTLGNALLKMRNQLKSASEEEKNRLWLTEGLAQINRILRDESGSKHWHMDIISFLLNYLDANVGGIYLVEEEHGEEKVNLKACIAYNREKFNAITLEKHEGLIGSCIFEKKSIYLKAIPDSYLNITTGLGDTPPKCILLLPLKNNDTVMGVLEIASIKAFAKHQLEFLENISDSIGVAITSRANNENTKKLLKLSKSKTEELQALEEELRQNNEELMVTQEKLANQEKILVGKVDAIDRTVATIEFDTRGNIITANKKFLEIMGYEAYELEGQHHRIFCEKEYALSNEYKQFWETLSEGKVYKGDIVRFTKFREKINLSANYYPLFDSNKRVRSIFKIAIANQQKKEATV